MATKYILSLSDTGAALETVGGKGASLARLAGAGLPVPAGFHVTTAAYRAFVEENNLQAIIQSALEMVDLAQPSTLEQASQRIREQFVAVKVPAEIARAILQAYIALDGSDLAVAVRSSATAEDLPEASFAGQQETYLNVRGPAAVLEATRKCWASLWTARAIGYRARQGIDPDQVALAVVVQRLVEADAAGILFTADPVSGNRSQVMISAAWGLGEAVVGGLVTPDTLVVDKASGQVMKRETAEKQMMTVRVNGGTQEQAVPEALRKAPVLSDDLAAELTRLGVQIETLYGRPMDIEWALLGGHFAILQARPITALPEEETIAPVEWALPGKEWFYSRGSLAEHLPNPVTPLFATLGVRLANQVTNELMTAFMGGKTICVEFRTLNGYLYQGLRMGRKDWVNFAILMIKQTSSILRGSTKRWQEGRAIFAEFVRPYESKSVERLTAAELLEGVNALFLAAARFYTVVQASTLPATTTSETVFCNVYNRMIRNEGDPVATDFLMGFDTAPILAEKSLFDLAEQVKERPGLARYVLHTGTAALVSDLEETRAPSGVTDADWDRWREGFRVHLERYGGAVYDYDFGYPMPGEAPEPLLEAIKMYLEGKGSNPHQRQQAATRQREQATKAVLQRVGWPRRGWFEKALKWAQDIGPTREDSLADMGMAHVQIRRFAGELGRRFVRGGAIREAEDIYWLVEDEVEELTSALECGDVLADFSGRIPLRRIEWQARLKIRPPWALPETSHLAKMVPWAGEGDSSTNVLKGLGTSSGKVTAPARVLYGPEDFDQMKPGDVLVAVTTTPAWTPLFTMASAVVTDIGGPLSHSSIVAREYGIPAVMATGFATRRIRSGQVVTVDGAAGVVSW